MIDIKVSVIVPVYKAESYLRRCLDSLLSQSLENIEIILVDDGSPDGSGAICDEYAQRDNRIKVFHKPNGGVSSARQKGLDEAKGEYVIHVDPDDWVEPDMLEELYRKAKEEDADMVICDFFINKENCQNYVVQKPSALDHNTLLCELFQQLHGSCWNKLIRRVCYNRFNVSFPLELSLCEDLYVNSWLLKNDIKVRYLPKAFYHYEIYSNVNTLVGESYDYDYCILLEKRMSDLLRDTEAFKLARTAMRLNTVRRTFVRGTFSSRDFKCLFNGYKQDVLKDSSKTFKYFIYLSCCGGYKFWWRIWKLSQRMSLLLGSKL